MLLFPQCLIDSLVNLEGHILQYASQKAEAWKLVDKNPFYEAF